MTHRFLHLCVAFGFGLTGFDVLGSWSDGRPVKGLTVLIVIAVCLAGAVEAFERAGGKRRRR